jgi:DnaJ family protein C protein 11
VYGSSKALKKADESREVNKESASEVFDVTIPLNFLINDSGQLKVYFF